MESSALADRLRGILHPRGTCTQAVTSSNEAPDDSHLDLESVLGGDWRGGADGSCFVVDKQVDPRTPYGHATVGDLAAALQDAEDDTPVIAGGVRARPPFLFIDLETTGLSGGAGTYAFLVGCGWFDGGGSFVTRQYLLTEPAGERPLLATVAGTLANAGALVSFNGKSFDAPLLETRYLFNRLEWVGATLPHLDVLHPARRFWSMGGVLETSSCSLLALEQSVLGRKRVGDVPGHEIPARYFRFVRTGDARALVGVLEHNCQDLLSLAGLTARLFHLVRSGAPAARDACEALGLGRVYWRAGLRARAGDAYARAVAMSATPSLHPIRIAALRALALLSRRARQFDDAAAYWRRLLEVRECPRHVAREATEALAIHHEHRVRDLATAKAFALRILENGSHPPWHQAARHRLARIERKITSAERQTQAATLDLGDPLAHPTARS